MYNHVCIAFAFTLTLFLLSNVSAGSNGDAPQEGQDWIITQDTHVWDDNIGVKDIFLSTGKTLKLENVSLSIYGEVDLHGETTWINSTIYHEQDEVLDNISIYSKLEIINTKLTIKASSKNDDQGINKVYLHENSLFIIRDFDNDPKTKNDRSVVMLSLIHI